MALRVFTVSIARPPAVSEPAGAVDSAFEAIGQAIESALQNEDIAESEGATGAVEAIEAAVDAAAGVLESDVTLIVNESNVGTSTHSPTREQLVAALEQLKQQLLSSDLYTEAWWKANEEEET